MVNRGVNIIENAYFLIIICGTQLVIAFHRIIFCTISKKQEICKKGFTYLQMFFPKTQSKLLLPLSLTELNFGQPHGEFVKFFPHPLRNISQAPRDNACDIFPGR